MSLLTLESITKEYKARILLNGVSLRVHRGERLALVGANGSGKTTILKIAMGLEYPDLGQVIIAKSTKVGYVSQSLTELQDNNVLRETIRVFEPVLQLERKLRETEARMAEPEVSANPGLLEQLYDSYGRLTEQYERLDGYNLETKVKSTLLGLGLRPEALLQPISKLSGGEKMRVALARTLLLEPDLLILDEPTNHLDLFGIEWLEKFLRRFPGGVLLVSHDRYFLDQVATRVAELAGGGITEKSGNYSTFLAQKERRREYLVAEQKRIKREIRLNNELVSKLKGMRRITAAESRAKAGERLREELNTRIKTAIGEEHLSKTATLNLALAKTPHVSAEIAKADGLSKRYGEVVIFEAAHFLIRGGERIGLIGPNGSGKTTLINILLGLDTQYQGLARLGSWVRYGYLGQEIHFTDDNRTVLEELLSAGKGYGKEFTDREARDYLARFQFYGDEINKQLKVVSGGEQVRLTLACICLNEPHCLIMDEPTNHLDMPAREALEATIADFKGTVIAISHDRYYLNHCVNRILAIESHKIISYEGNYDFYRSRSLMMEVNGEQSPTGSTPAKSFIKKASGNQKENRSKTLGVNSPKLPRANAPEPIAAQIESLEKQLKEMEASFNSETSYQVYQEYEALLKQMNLLYETWSAQV
jgi:ATP-binding cassette subfamily F protein 3